MAVGAFGDTQCVPDVLFVQVKVSRPTVTSPAVAFRAQKGPSQVPSVL